MFDNTRGDKIEIMLQSTVDQCEALDAKITDKETKLLLDTDSATEEDIAAMINLTTQLVEQCKIAKTRGEALNNLFSLSQCSDI